MIKHWQHAFEKVGVSPGPRGRGVVFVAYETQGAQLVSPQLHWTQVRCWKMECANRSGNTMSCVFINNEGGGPQLKGVIFTVDWKGLEALQNSFHSQSHSQTLRRIDVSTVIVLDPQQSSTCTVHAHFPHGTLDPDCQSGKPSPPPRNRSHQPIEADEDTSTSPTNPVTETLRAPTAARPFLNRLHFVGGQFNHAFVQFQQFSQRQLAAGARCPTICKFTAPACHEHAASSSIRDRHLEVHSTVARSTATTAASRPLLSPHRSRPLPARPHACL
jgi:hypothetical protein